MTNALATQQENTGELMQRVADELAKKRNTLRALLPKEITPERMRALALTSIRKNPLLLKCTAESIVGCVYEASKLGLVPDTASALCHLVPRRNNKMQCHEAQFEMGYRGMMVLARRAAPMASIKAEHVCERDMFEWSEGLDPILRHKRASAGNRGEITHAYAIARMTGFVELKVVDADDIKRARKTAKSTAWQHHPGAMWEKTAIKRLCKTLPIHDPGASENLHRAIELDDAADDERPQDVGADFLGGEDVIVTQVAPEPHLPICPACHYPNGDHKDGCPEGP